MKIVIDIPKEEYEYLIKEHAYKPCGFGEEYYEVIIANGTPLPKGHGRLIDAEDLFSFISDHAYHIRYDCNSIEKGMSITGINECIRIRPTIIEADTTRDCKTC